MKLPFYIEAIHQFFIIFILYNETSAWSSRNDES